VSVSSRKPTRPPGLFLDVIRKGFEEVKA